MITRDRSESQHVHPASFVGGTLVPELTHGAYAEKLSRDVDEKGRPKEMMKSFSEERNICRRRPCPHEIKRFEILNPKVCGN
jgi:hypothetical protein